MKLCEIFWWYEIFRWMFFRTSSLNQILAWFDIGRRKGESPSPHPTCQQTEKVRWNSLADIYCIPILILPSQTNQLNLTLKRTFQPRSDYSPGRSVLLKWDDQFKWPLSFLTWPSVLIPSLLGALLRGCVLVKYTYKHQWQMKRQFQWATKLPRVQEQRESEMRGTIGSGCGWSESKTEHIRATFNIKFNTPAGASVHSLPAAQSTDNQDSQ